MALPAGFRLSRFDAAIVDLDGTMVDTLGDFDAALNRTLSDLGLSPIAREDIALLVGKGSEHLVRSTLARVRGGQAADVALFGDAFDRYQAHYDRVNGQHATVFDGVPEGLAGLRAAGMRLACITNKPGAFARPLLAAKGLAGYFDHVFGGDAFERKKPDPLPLVKACEALGSAPARTLMIGDSSNDAAAARGAGCPVVLVSYGFNHGEPVESVGADGVVDSLEALAAAGTR